MNRNDRSQGPIVTGFTSTGFKVRESTFEGGLFLTPERALGWPEAPACGQLSIEMLDDVLELTPAPEFLLLGTGANLQQPPRKFVRALEERGIGVEVMDSRAAARAWGVLRLEERWIVAALLPL